MPRPSRAARRGDFHFITSMVWVRIGNSGLKDPKGSCGMKVILRPRISLSACQRGIVSRSSPAKRIDPASRRALLAKMPRIALASVVLPQPDSPTSPMISPGRIVKLTPSSTLATPCSVANETRRFSTSRRLSPGAGTANPWIEDIAQPVAQEIEAHYDDKDGKSRRQGVPPGLGQELARIGDHASSFRCRGRRTETEESERAGRENGEAHADRRAHDDRRGYVRQNVQEDDAPRRHAQRDRGLDEGLILERAHLGVDEAGEPRPIGG